jgi:hypothetical protein
MKRLKCKKKKIYRTATFHSHNVFRHFHYISHSFQSICHLFGCSKTIPAKSLYFPPPKIYILHSDEYKVLNGVDQVLSIFLSPLLINSFFFFFFLKICVNKIYIGNNSPATSKKTYIGLKMHYQFKREMIFQLYFIYIP